MFAGRGPRGLTTTNTLQTSLHYHSNIAWLASCVHVSLHFYYNLHAVNATIFLIWSKYYIFVRNDIRTKIRPFERQNRSTTIYRCAWGTCSSDSRYYWKRDDLKNVFFLSIPKPVKAKVKCLQWIKSCNRLYEQLNVQNINHQHYICSKHFTGGFGP